MCSPLSLSNVFTGETWPRYEDATRGPQGGSGVRLMAVPHRDPHSQRPGRNLAPSAACPAPCHSRPLSFPFCQPKANWCSRGTAFGIPVPRSKTSPDSLMRRQDEDQALLQPGTKFSCYLSAPPTSPFAFPEPCPAYACRGARLQPRLLVIPKHAAHCQTQLC